MRKIKVILYGVGVVGSMIARAMIEKEGLDIVGAIDTDKDKVGKDLGDILRLKRKLGVYVSEDINHALSKETADLAIHATSSYLEIIYPQITSIVQHNLNVLSTCEELSYPNILQPILARKLDTLAKKHKVSVLGTGINPGFLMDTLIITLTAPCQKIDEIKATRIIDAASRRLPFQKKIGAGLTPAEFQKRIETKQITGHIGLEQSIAMIASALAWKLDKIVAEPVDPITARESVCSQDLKVEAGNVAGLRQKANGIIEGRPVILLDFKAYIGAKKECDTISIRGVPNITQTIRPCVHGDLGTVAIIINSIPKVINAPPGLFSMKDLSVPSAATEDIRKYIKRNSRRSTHKCIMES